MCPRRGTALACSHRLHQGRFLRDDRGTRPPLLGLGGVGRALSLPPHPAPVRGARLAFPAEPCHALHPLGERLWGCSQRFAPSQPSPTGRAGEGRHPPSWQSPAHAEAGHGMGATPDAAPPSTLAGATTAAPQGNPSPGPQPVGAGTSSPALPSPSPPPLAGREESGVLAEPSLGRNQPGRRVPAQSQIRPAGAHPLPPTAGSPRRWADKARPLQVPKRRPGDRPPGRTPARDRQQRQQDGGWGRRQDRAGPPSAAGCKHPCPHTSRPPGTQATAVTTISFYSLHLYITRYKTLLFHPPAPGQHRHGPARPALRPQPPGTHHTGARPGSGGVPGVPPMGDGPTLPSASPGAAGARAGQGPSLRPPGCWEGQAPGMAPSIRGTGSEPPPRHEAGGSRSAESPQETWGAGAAHGPGPL